MKLTKIGFLAAMMVGAMMVATPALQAQENKEAPKRERPEGREGRPRPTGDDAIKARVERMSENLKLTDDQKTKLTEVFKSQAEKMREARGDREKMTAMREENDKKIKEILTAEQYTKYKERPQGGGPGGPGKKKKDE